MNNFLSALMITLLTVLSASSQVNFENISVEQAVARAEKEGKKVFLYMHANWNAPCKLMMAEVFSDKELGKRMDKTYIALKIEDRSYNPPLQDYFNRLVEMPMIFILGEKGFDLGQIKGYRTLSALNQELDKYEGTMTHPITDALAELEAHPADQKIWKENLGKLIKPARVHNYRLYHDFELYCKEYYKRFPVTSVEDAVDLAIFSHAALPIEHPVAQFYVNDSIDFASAMHMEYKVMDFITAVRAAKSKKEKDAMRTQFEAYYDIRYDAAYGDVASKAFYVEYIFGIKEEIWLHLQRRLTITASSL